MNQRISPVPECAPLGPIQHAIIAEQGVHMPNGILKNRPGVERLVSIRIDAFTKDQLAEYRIWVGGDNAFYLIEYCEWKTGRGSNRRRICD